MTIPEEKNLSPATNISVRFSGKRLQGQVGLPASKSITNRLLIFHALAGGDFDFSNASGAEDSQVLRQILESFRKGGSHFNAGHAGTAFRFLTAFFAIQEGVQELSGSARMHRRPIGPLVEALRQTGAQIEYLEEEGYPPLRIGSPEFTGRAEVTVPADVSSQFLSALYMIAPYLPQGLRILPQDRQVSGAYAKMTLDLMAQFGAAIEQDKEGVRIAPGGYTLRPYRVESDWSAAAPFFGMAALAEEAGLFFPGLRAESLQGDRVLCDLGRLLGLECSFEGGGLRLVKARSVPDDVFDADFIDCPDLAQSFVVTTALAQKPAFFSGLDTLRIKETNRIVALQRELAKIGIAFTKLPARFSERTKREIFSVAGVPDLSQVPVFETYDDHRMGMALSIAAIKGSVIIEHPGVVRKSFPEFWKELEALGFEIRPV